jgi:hypothetical protein
MRSSRPLVRSAWLSRLPAGRPCPVLDPEFGKRFLIHSGFSLKSGFVPKTLILHHQQDFPGDQFGTPAPH